MGCREEVTRVHESMRERRDGAGRMIVVTCETSTEKAKRVRVGLASRSTWNICTSTACR